MDRRGITLATLVIMAGALATSVLGFVRAFVVARYFGAHTDTDAFFAALVAPQILAYGLIGGAVSAVLIPTFSRLASEDEGELWLIVRTVFALEAILALCAIAVLELGARPLMLVTASGFGLPIHAGALPLSVRLVRILLPTLLFSSLSAVALAVLYSQRRRAMASLAPSCFHLGIIAAAIVGAARFGITALAVGAVAGAALQCVIQIPSLWAARRLSTGGQTRPLVDFHHPIVRHLSRLYLPAAAGVAIAIAGQVIELNFKSHLPESGGLSGMQYANQLLLFPVGIVAAALAFAVLPTLSREAEQGRQDSFADTLFFGTRLSLILMAPTMVGALVLATPLVALVFQRGQFTQLDTIFTVQALTGYAPQLLLLGINQLLVYAFYARRNTVVPALAAGAGVLIYIVSAFLLARFTILGLAVADTLSVGAQTLLLLILLWRALTTLQGSGMLETMLKVAAAGTCMAIATAAASHIFGHPGTGLALRLENVMVPGLIGLTVYVAVLAFLWMDEVRLWRLSSPGAPGAGYPDARRL